MLQTEIFNAQTYSNLPNTDDWSSDDWETPPEVARFMSSLVQSSELLIMEPAAGTGAIAQHLPNGTTCVELNPIRHMAGMVPYQKWLCENFLDYAENLCEYWHETGETNNTRGFHLIIGNPPFSFGMEFLQSAFTILRDEGRILFLLPSEFFQSQARAAALKDIGLCITRQWSIAGRVGFIKQGKVCNQRQCYDSVFELRDARHFKAAVEIVDPYNKL